MIKLAICDDCKEDRNLIREFLERFMKDYGNPVYEIYSFHNGTDLCDSLNNISYDIILLDILMTSLDGIETARHIRSKGEESVIIFISNYDKRLKELFRIGTAAFLDKPLQYNELEAALIHANDLIHNGLERIFCYKKNSSTYFVPIKEILYFEAHKNVVVIHTVKQDISYTQSLISVWSDVKRYDMFIMPGKSFIVSLKYFNISKNKIMLDEKNGSIQIGRPYKEETMNRYMNYMERRMDG